MRLFLVALLTIAGAIYSIGAVYFFTQQRLASDEIRDEPPSLEKLRHPEAMLTVVRRSFDDNDFLPPRLEIVERAMLELPSYYQPPFLIALYHSNRLEQPERTSRAFEAALRRYPANGRLHLAFAQWLWSSRLYPSGATHTVDARKLAERHLATALQLEPDLARVAIDVLREHRIPPTRWSSIFPDESATRRQLLLALSEAGERSEALSLLRESLVGERDARWLQTAAQWAFQWGDLELALETAKRWLEIEQSGPLRRGHSRASLFIARVHLEMGASDEAYESFRRALDAAGAASPDGLEILCTMANEYARNGQVVLAQSLYGEATAVAPRHVPALLGLAQTFRQMGEREEAIIHFRKVLELDPNNSVAERALGQMLSQTSREESPRS
jgi:tetratricopeptide (TPR) repeat protein